MLRKKFEQHSTTPQLIGLYHIFEIRNDFREEFDEFAKLDFMYH